MDFKPKFQVGEVIRWRCKRMLGTVTAVLQDVNYGESFIYYINIINNVGNPVGVYIHEIELELKE